MPKKRKDIVRDEREEALFRALEDEEWDWRTIAAIERESGMSEEEVSRTLEKDKEYIKKSSIPDKTGKELYTLKSRYYKRILLSPITKSANIFSTSLKSVYEKRDIEVCPVCKSELINGKCTKGHNINKRSD